MIGIYLIKNKINGKCYVGQADNIERRWKEHKRHYKLEKHKNQLIYKAFNKYGIENFSFSIIEECLVEELDEKEIFYIDKYNTYAFKENSNGYNMTLGGKTCRGCVHSEEQNKRHSEFMKGRTPVNKGVPMSEEQKEKLRVAMLGRTLTEERKKKISNSLKGRIITEEAKNKISEFQKAYRQTEEGCVKGGKNPRAKRVKCEGKTFECIKECAEFYGINYGAMKRWLQHPNKMRQDFVEKGLSFLEESI